MLAELPRNQTVLTKAGISCSLQLSLKTMFEQWLAARQDKVWLLMLRHIFPWMRKRLYLYWWLFCCSRSQVWLWWSCWWHDMEENCEDQEGRWGERQDLLPWDNSYYYIFILWVSFRILAWLCLLFVSRLLIELMNLIEWKTGFQNAEWKLNRTRNGSQEALPLLTLQHFSTTLWFINNRGHPALTAFLGFLLDLMHKGDVDKSHERCHYSHSSLIPSSRT